MYVPIYTYTEAHTCTRMCAYTDLHIDTIML